MTDLKCEEVNYVVLYRNERGPGMLGECASYHTTEEEARGIISYLDKHSGYYSSGHLFKRVGIE